VVCSAPALEHGAYAGIIKRLFAAFNAQKGVFVRLHGWIYRFLSRLPRNSKRYPNAISQNEMPGAKETVRKFMMNPTTKRMTEIQTVSCFGAENFMTQPPLSEYVNIILCARRESEYPYKAAKKEKTPSFHRILIIAK
jgi:hypothetical protein